MKSCAPTARAAASISSCAAASRPNARLSRIVPLNRNASCGTIPIWERSERELTVGRVRERHPLELELAADRAELDRTGPVAHVGLLVEQLEDLVERRHPGLISRVELGELLDRVEEVVECRDERKHDPRRGVT